MTAPKPKPLAEIFRSDSGYWRIRVGEFETSYGSFTRENEQPDCDAINAAHEKAVAPLRMLLRYARIGLDHRACPCAACDAFKAELFHRIDAENVGEWVPKADFDRLKAQSVALEAEVAANIWQQRARMAVDILSASGAWEGSPDRITTAIDCLRGKVSIVVDGYVLTTRPVDQP